MFRYLLSFFLFSGGGHIDQNGIFDYNVKKKKKKKKKKLQVKFLKNVLICNVYTMYEDFKFHALYIK